MTTIMVQSHVHVQTMQDSLHVNGELLTKFSYLMTVGYNSLVTLYMTENEPAIPNLPTNANTTPSVMRAE